MKVEYEKLLFRSSLRCSSFVFLQKWWCTVFGDREINNHLWFFMREIKHFFNQTKGSQNESWVSEAAVSFVPLLFILCFSKKKVVCTVLGMKGIKYFSIVLFVHSMLKFYFSTEEVCLDIGSRKIIGFRVFDHLRLNYQIFKVCYFICPFSTNTCEWIIFEFLLLL